MTPTRPRFLAKRGLGTQSDLVSDRSNKSLLNSLSTGSPSLRDEALSDLGLFLFELLSPDFASLLPEEMIEELVQECLARTLEKLGDFDDSEKLNAWLRELAHQLAKEEVGRRGLLKESGASDAG